MFPKLEDDECPLQAEKQYPLFRGVGYSLPHPHISISIGLAYISENYEQISIKFSEISILTGR